MRNRTMRNRIMRNRTGNYSIFMSKMFMHCFIQSFFHLECFPLRVFYFVFFFYLECQSHHHFYVFVPWYSFLLYPDRFYLHAFLIYKNNSSFSSCLCCLAFHCFAFHCLAFHCLAFCCLFSHWMSDVDC